jgi:hypothetical protein
VIYCSQIARLGLLIIDLLALWYFRYYKSLDFVGIVLFTF